MPRCWWFVVVLLALVHIGKTEVNNNNTDLPVSSTTEKPGFIQNVISSISNLFRGKKPDTSSSPPINRTSSTGAEHDIHVLNPDPATDLFKKNQSGDLQGSNRDPKCLPPANQTVSTSTDNSIAQGDRFLNILGEIENMTINITSGNQTQFDGSTSGNQTQLVGNIFGNQPQINNGSANETDLRVGRELATDLINNSLEGKPCHSRTKDVHKDSNRSARCVVIPKGNVSSPTAVATDNSNVLLGRVFQLFGEIENETLDAISKNTSRKQNSSSGIDIDNLLRVGKGLEIDNHKNDSIKRHGYNFNDSKTEVGSSKSNRYNYKASKNLENSTLAFRYLFYKFFGLGQNKEHSNQTTDRVARYIKHLSKKGNRKHYFAPYLEKMKANNWTYARTARYIIDRNFSRDSRNTEYDEYYYFYDGPFQDEFSERSAGFDDVWEDLFSFNGSDSDGIATDQSSRDFWYGSTRHSEFPDYQIVNDTIEIILFDSDIPDRESRELDSHSAGNDSSHENVAWYDRSLPIDNETTVQSGMSVRSDILKSNKVSTSNTNNTSVDITPKFGIETHVPSVNATAGDNATDDGTDNNTNASLTPKFKLPLQFHKGDRNGTIPSWNKESNTNATFDVTPKWANVIEVELNETEGNVTNLELKPKDFTVEIDILAEIESSGPDRNLMNESSTGNITGGVTNLTAFRLSGGGNGTEYHLQENRLVFTLVMDDDTNSTDNSSVIGNVTHYSMDRIFTFLKTNHTDDRTANRYAYNTSSGNTSVGRTNYHFHLQDEEDSHLSNPPNFPQPSEEYNFVEQPPYVWREPNQRLKIYIPPPLLHHFYNPEMNLIHPQLKLVCPPTATQRCPTWLVEGRRKCYFPMDCPLPSQLCCQVGCGIECAHGILVPVPPHYY